MSNELRVMDRVRVKNTKQEGRIVQIEDLIDIDFPYIVEIKENGKYNWHCFEECDLEKINKK